MRRFADYDPDENSRFDGDDDDRWQRGCCQSAAEIGEIMERAAAERRAMYGDAPKPFDGARKCQRCHGQGYLVDAHAYGANTLTECWSCAGQGIL